LRAAFKRLEKVYQAQEGTPQADEMEILVTLIEAYEQKHFPIGVVDPVEAILSEWNSRGLPRKTWSHISAQAGALPKC
jgi:HTH-type transcriptional regulator/antitoxin HigA